MLDDVAHYTDGYASTKVLAHTWDRINELLLQIDDSGVSARLRWSVSRTSAAPAGGWQSVR